MKDAFILVYEFPLGKQTANSIYYRSTLYGITRLLIRKSLCELIFSFLSKKCIILLCCTVLQVKGPLQEREETERLQDQNEYLTYLVNTYGDMVYRLAMARVRNPHDAQDIVQQVFLKLVCNIEKLESEEHVKAWLITVTVNEGKSLFSTAWRRHTASLEENAEAQDLSAPSQEIEETNDILKAVNCLPEKYRVVIHLFYYHDLSTEEIAKILGRSNHTVRSQLSRAREKMRKDLKGVFEDV